MPFPAHLTHFLILFLDTGLMGKCFPWSTLGHDSLCLLHLFWISLSSRKDNRLLHHPQSHSVDVISDLPVFPVSSTQASTPLTCLPTLHHHLSLLAGYLPVTYILLYDSCPDNPQVRQFHCFTLLHKILQILRMARNNTLFPLVKILHLCSDNQYPFLNYSPVPRTI